MKHEEIDPFSHERAKESLTPQRPRDIPPIPLAHLKEEGPGPREFVVTVAHAQTGRVFSPFIVQAKDESGARTLCKRNYLVVQSVKRYIGRDGQEKPRVLPFGPPISDRDFELDYGNRPPDRPRAGAMPFVLALLWGFLFGPIGAMIGWWAGHSAEKDHSSD